MLSAAIIKHQDLVVILSRGLGVLLFSVCREKCMEVYKIKMNPPEGGGFKFRGSFKLYQRHCDYALAEEGFEFCIVHQSNCLICLPDKSGDFLAFRAKTAQNTVKPEKTGFGMAITARLRPVFCVFGPKITHTFWGKCTEQRRRKNLAEGGFEPEWH